MIRKMYMCGGRPKAFWGAVIGAAASLAQGLLSSNAQKKEAERQKQLEDYQAAVQTANSTASAVNQSRAAEEHYQEQFRQPYSIGGRKKRLAEVAITDGGEAIKVGNNTYLLRGGSHEDINESGQTGIGLNVGGQEIEGENNEVVQARKNDVRIFSDRLRLADGRTPAQAVLDGANKDKVFAIQEAIKRYIGAPRTAQAALGEIVAVQPRRVSYRNPIESKINRSSWWNYLGNDRLKQFYTIFDNNGDPYEVNPMQAFFRGTAIGNGRRLVTERPKKAWGDYITYKGKRYTIDGRPVDENGNIKDKYYDSEPGGRQTWMPDYGLGTNGIDIDPDGEGAVAIGRRQTPQVPPTSGKSWQPREVAPPVGDSASRKSLRDRMGMIVKGGDWIGLGTDLIGSLSLGWLTGRAARAGYRTPDAPARLSAAKLNTTYNINPQLADNERNRIAVNNAIARDTISSAASLARQGVTNTNATSTLNQLYAEKENKENEYINADAMNQQDVAVKNAELQRDWQYKVNDILNEQARAKERAGQISLQGIAGAANNFLGQTMQRYEDVQALKAYAAASHEGTTGRMISAGLDDTGELAQTVLDYYRSLPALTVPTRRVGESEDDFNKRMIAYNEQVKDRRNQEIERNTAWQSLMRSRRGRRWLERNGYKDDDFKLSPYYDYI